MPQNAATRKSTSSSVFGATAELMELSVGSAGLMADKSVLSLVSCSAGIPFFSILVLQTSNISLVLAVYALRNLRYF